MREDFKEKIEELNKIGIVRVCADFYQRPNSRLFVKSPATQDKHFSMRLYPATNSFCDYANGNIGGDIIRFVAYVCNIDNWKSLLLLSEFYGLSCSKERKRQEVTKEIKWQQDQERKRQTRQQEFKTALFGHIGELKQQEQNYKDILAKDACKPFCEVWCYVIEQIQSISRRLNILCASDCVTYRRMKPDIEKGFFSDRPRWLLDTLAILAEENAFQATQNELEEIKAQNVFEMCDRLPGKDRRCWVTW